MTTSASLHASAALEAGVIPCSLARFERIGGEVEGDDFAASLGLIGGHARAHVAEADECDAGHEGCAPMFEFVLARERVGTCAGRANAART
jgi:hypothetical protein